MNIRAFKEAHRRVVAALQARLQEAMELRGVWFKTEASPPAADSEVVVWFQDGTEMVCTRHEFIKSPGIDRYPSGVWDHVERGIHRTRPLSEGPFWKGTGGGPS